MDPLTYQRLHPRSYLERFLAEGFRPDGREPGNFRDVQVNVGSITTADGSALVRLGETTILCGVKAEICEPDAARPGEGYIVPNLDLPAMCSTRFRPGPPGEEAQVWSDRLLELLVDNNVVPLSTLCIHPGKAAWVLYLDLVCINYDGNAFDASVLAVLAALRNTRLPRAVWDEDRRRVVCSRKEERMKLSVQRWPVACTFGVFDGQRLLADPTAFEEPLLDTHITVALDENGYVAGLHLAGLSAVHGVDSMAVVQQCIDAARARNKVLMRVLNGT